ncbi:DUF58 domain-containing protein [Planococcus lenghuensis]|uniref:Uncharacterized protein n=1 Tax=Planococcus lenghuensis TaxID=2213202 RepID=A0A1Q2L089_9BACL|nr:DUF58 domain-containing protein [Planococcus lenghuensis]AQQ53870.1 hypothetical protein B0X71_12730 [Planococcus lenghuensis]
MEWDRDHLETHEEKRVLALLLLFLFLTTFMRLYIAAAVLVFAGIIIGMQFYYINHAGEKLVLVSGRVRKRLLPGGSSEWDLEFINRGLPIWGGKLKVFFPDVAEPVTGGEKRFGELVEVDIPFTAGFRKTVRVRLPIEGKRRGLAKIQSMELYIPHPFGEGQSMLKYNKPVRQEILVYPKLYPLSPDRSSSKLRPGQLEVRDSVFDDLFQPIGTRDYAPSDQFHHIHWKASARLQRYQTKVFSKTADESILFIADVASRYSTIPHLEERIEELASLVDRCAKDGIAFSVAVNVRSAGKVPYLYLPEGTGQKQRQRALELLAVISKNDSVIPLPNILAHLDFHVQLPVRTYVLTDDSLRIGSFVAKWSQRTDLKIQAIRNGGTAG